MVTSFQTGLGNIESLCWCYQEKDKCKFHTLTFFLLQPFDTGKAVLGIP